MSAAGRDPVEELRRRRRVELEEQEAGIRERLARRYRAAVGGGLVLACLATMMLGPATFAPPFWLVALAAGGLGGALVVRHEAGPAGGGMLLGGLALGAIVAGMGAGLLGATAILGAIAFLVVFVVGGLALAGWLDPEVFEGSFLPDRGQMRRIEEREAARAAAEAEAGGDAAAAPRGAAGLEDLPDELLRGKMAELERDAELRREAGWKRRNFALGAAGISFGAGAVMGAGGAIAFSLVLAVFGGASAAAIVRNRRSTFAGSALLLGGGVFLVYAGYGSGLLSPHPAVFVGLLVYLGAALLIAHRAQDVP